MLKQRIVPRDGYLAGPLRSRGRVVPAKTAWIKFRLVLTVLTLFFSQLWYGCASRDSTTDNQSSTANPASPPYGFSLLQDMRLLSLLPGSVFTRQVSSHSRNGGNTDFGNYGEPSGRETYLYREEGMKVILDEQGPGCINRIWMTSPFMDTVGPVQIFLDNMDRPVVDMPAMDFFSGLVPPFLYPLAGSREVSSGGYYCYMPMPFQQRCKIRIGGALLYYDIDYFKFSGNPEVATFTGEEDVTAVLDLLNHSGGDPLHIHEKNSPYSGEVVLEPGEKECFFQEQGPAWILSLKLRPDSFSPSILSSVWLYGLWDDPAEAQVAAPLSDFFGSGLGPEPVRAFPLGISIQEGWLYSYFPMPYDTEGSLCLENRGSVSSGFYFEIGYAERPSWAAPGKVGTFHAQWNEENPTTLNRDYRILAAEGWGNYVGCTVTMYGGQTEGNTLAYLEGDERVYVDDSLSPILYGTGAEDYFNGGWYFENGTFSLPFHGNPASRKQDDGRNFTGCYRFHVLDPVPFYKNILFGIEHGGFNEQQARFTSVAYYYARSEPALVLTDRLDVGDRESEDSHRYQTEGEEWSGEATFFYEGDRDGTAGYLLPLIGPPLTLPARFSPEAVSDTGRTLRSSSSFSVKLDPENKGVRLRRRTDAAYKDQSARVLVDGEPLPSLWRTPGWNTVKRWRDTEYEIPARYTSGRESINLLIQVEQGEQNRWSEFFYWVYCYR